MIVEITCETSGPREPDREPPKGARAFKRWLAAERRWFRFRVSSATVWLLGDEDVRRCLETASALASLAKRGVITVTIYGGGELTTWKGPITGRETREYKLRMKAALDRLNARAA